MKRTVLLLLFLLSVLLSSCGYDFGREEKKTVVCTVFAGYDWTRQLTDGVDSFDVVYLLSNGTDSHSFQPTVKDIAMIEKCDIFIYTGGESEQWANGLAAERQKKELLTVNMTEILSDSLLEEYEGIQNSEETQSHSGEEEHQTDDEEGEADEHVWLSFSNADAVCCEISAALKKISPEDSARIEKNLSVYKSSLQKLDERYRPQISDSTIKDVVFADRFPFIYMLEDYGISYKAAFSGCSAESEASVSTVAELIRLTECKNLPSVCVIETSDRKLAYTVARECKREISVTVFDSLQSVSKTDIDNGKTYYSSMEKNLKALLSALGQ